MKSINRVTFLGHVVNDPILKSTKSGKMLATFSIATNNEWNDADGVLKQSTDFHRIVAWDGLAKIVSKYIAKGSPLHLEGRLVNRSYEAKDGLRHFITEVVAKEIHILKWKSEQKQLVSKELIEANDEKELVTA